jgi:hypothetical protein
MDDHKTVDVDTDYDVTFHPAFASRCAVTHKDGSEKELYKQKSAHNLGKNGHPKSHVVKIRGKNGRTRDITITIDDPNHAIHSLRMELYDEGYDPMAPQPFMGGDVVTIENQATTCPPNCEGE